MKTEIIEIVVNSWIFKTSLSTIIVALIGIVIAKINNSATKKDLEKVKKEAFDYTDDKISNHTVLHKSIEDNFIDLKSDNERVESKVDKILFLLAKK